MRNLMAWIFGIGVVGSVFGFFIWAMRSGGKLIEARNAALARVAESHGLTVKPLSPSSPSSMIFTAEGTFAGAPMRMAIDRVDRRGQSTRELLRVVVRTSSPLPTIVVHRRDGSDRSEVAPNLHEVSTGDDAFDQAFITATDDDAAALDFLSAVRAELLVLGSASFGVESFKVGSEVALVVDCIHPRFFAEGHLEQAVKLVTRLASSPSGYRAA